MIHIYEPVDPATSTYMPPRLPPSMPHISFLPFSPTSLNRLALVYTN